MSNKAIAWSFFALGGLLLTPAIADDKDVQLFQALYDELHVAVGQRDREKILALMAPDFVSIELSDRTQTAEQMVTDILRLPKSSNPREIQTTVLNAEGDGKTEQVDQTYRSTTTKVDAAGVQTIVEINAKSHDTWVLLDGKWLMKSTRTDELEMKKNGVEVLHKKRPTI